MKEMFTKFYKTTAQHWDLTWVPFMDHMMMFWVVGFVCFGIDMVVLMTDNIPRVKFQRGQEYSLRLYAKTALYALRNQLTVNLLLGIPWVHLMVWRGCHEAVFPSSPFYILAQLALLIIWEEIWFYSTHRLLHIRALYGTVHKRHHEFKAPIAISALYAHWFEHLLANVLPVISGPLVFGYSLEMMRLWIVLSTLNGLIAHSGYNFTDGMHDIHHLTTNYNFGVLGWLDYLCGTYKNPSDIYGGDRKKAF